MAQLFDLIFETVSACPACGGRVLVPEGALAIPSYRFGGYSVEYRHVAPRIMVMHCGRCGLFFKDLVPTKKSLEAIFTTCAGRVFNPRYTYKPEMAYLKHLLSQARPEEVSLLDIGAGEGALLRRFCGMRIRLSALDVIANDGCRQVINCEYILGYLDDNLNWSEEPYFVVTILDVLEHLYSVKKSFQNLSSLVQPGGYCYIETGNPGCHSTRRYGVHNWWYLNMVQHHVAYPQRTIEYLARKHGFEVISITRKRHKQRAEWTLPVIVKKALKSGIYRLKMGMNPCDAVDRPSRRPQPAPPFEKDHIRIVLRKRRLKEVVSFV